MNKTKKINLRSFRELLLVGVVIILCIIWTIMNSQFLSANNISNILRQASYTAIAAVGMTMVIIIGEIDLSAGSLVCAAGLVGAVVCKNTDNVFFSVIAAIAVGAVIGTVNGVNFTDGLDGLASSVTLIVAVFFTVVSIGTKSGIEPVTGAVVGGLMGFLLFNVYPAKVFMGDTGSLALGGFVAGVAYAMQMPLFIILVGLIYLIEVLSVMIQVSYFKATHGKRIFKMAPIHHHFELCGWSETRVVAVFSVVTAIMCLIALLAL